MSEPQLFKNVDFISHSGLPLGFKIDCDALMDEDIEALASIISLSSLRFNTVEGIPRGGTKLAKALRKYTVSYSSDVHLIVDDVFTTGSSMKRAKDAHPDQPVVGVVIFARTTTPSWIYPIFQLSSIFQGHP